MDDASPTLIRSCLRSLHARSWGLILWGIACQALAVDATLPDGAIPAPRPAAAEVAPSVDSVRQLPLFDSPARHDLASRGISFTSRVIAQLAGNETGYRGNGWKHSQDTNLGVSWDLGKLGVADSGIVRVMLSDRSGETLQDYTGAYIQNQSHFGQGQNFRFDELSYEHAFHDKRLAIKIGFHSMGNEFGLLPYTCNLTTNAFCGHPLALAQGSGWQNSPTGQWGLRARWNDPSGWYAATGAYDVTPARKDHEHGFDLGFPGHTTGYIFPWEVGYSHGNTPTDYAGTYRVGGYLDTSNAAEVGRPGRTVQSRYGFHVQAAQQVWKPEPNTVRGIALFAVLNTADQRSGLFEAYYELGASWRGVVGKRENDILSVGFAQADLNSNLRTRQRLMGQAQQTHEQIWEINYTVQATPWLLVRPTLQYVVRPHALDERPDTAVFVLHLQATL